MVEVVLRAPNTYRYKGVTFRKGVRTHASDEDAAYLVGQGCFAYATQPPASAAKPTKGKAKAAPPAPLGEPVDKAPEVPALPANGFETKTSALEFARDVLAIELDRTVKDKVIVHPDFNENLSLKKLQTNVEEAYRKKFKGALLEANEMKIAEDEGVEELNPRNARRAADTADTDGAVAI